MLQQGITKLYKNFHANKEKQNVLLKVLKKIQTRNMIIPFGILKKLTIVN